VVVGECADSVCIKAVESVYKLCKTVRNIRRGREAPETDFGRVALLERGVEDMAFAGEERMDLLMLTLSMKAKWTDSLHSCRRFGRFSIDFLGCPKQDSGMRSVYTSSICRS
jgi:hypothetical protein